MGKETLGTKPFLVQGCKPVYVWYFSLHDFRASFSASFCTAQWFHFQMSSGDSTSCYALKTLALEKCMKYKIYFSTLNLCYVEMKLLHEMKWILCHKWALEIIVDFACCVYGDLLSFCWQVGKIKMLKTQCAKLKLCLPVFLISLLSLEVNDD